MGKKDKAVTRGVEREAMTQEYYALGAGRSAAAVLRFLDFFLPRRVPVCDDYPVPELADTPRLVLRSESEILEYLERHTAEPYSLYWNDPQGTGAQAMLFYTRDGNVIYGLADWSAAPSERLEELGRFVGATFCTLGTEQRPPDTTPEFVAMCGH